MVSDALTSAILHRSARDKHPVVSLSFMIYSIVTGFSFSIGLAAIIGGLRYNRINPAYYPFLYCCWIGLMNECISFIESYKGHSNAINSNIYVLLEFILFIWQFYRWGFFGRHRYWWPVPLIIIGGVWIWENFFPYRLDRFSSYFRVLYSFSLVLMSISILNRQIVREKQHLLKNPIALICLGTIIYYTYKVLVEAFWLYGLNQGSNFRNNVYLILAFINLFTNLIFALAVLWMPKKLRFTLPY
jgi:hypothetical protein